MTPSAGVRDLISRTYRMLTGGEGDPDTLFADDDGVVGIGSDPDEWWEGHDRLCSVFRAQGEALRGSQIENSDPVAYAVGEVGWVADRPTIVAPNGSTVSFRVTATAIRAGDDWRFVQWHGSVGVPNVEALGTELPI
jgi:hypothetical protein